MDLRDSLVLLFATATVSGFVIPWVLKRIDSRRETQQRDRELERARRDKLMDAQVSFLDRFTDKIWAWRYLLIRVTYYGGISDDQGYQQARQTYSETIWSDLNNIRVEISRASRLVSPSVLEEMQAFYQRIVALDRELLSVAAIEDPLERRMTYKDLNQTVFLDVSNAIDALLRSVADDLHLSSTTYLKKSR